MPTDPKRNLRSARTKARPPAAIHLIFELARNADTLDSENACEARVLDAKGDTVWQRGGFNARLDPWTGHDVNGDGVPDAVVGVDVGGGNGCCWEHTIVTLAAPPRAIATLSFNPLFWEDAHGRTVIFETVAFYGLGPDMADSPTLTRVHQVRGDTLVRITSEYCAALLADTTRRAGWPWPTPHPSADERVASRRTTGKVPYEVEQTRVAVASLALQELECGERDTAERLIEETRPAAEAGARWAAVYSAWGTREDR